MWVNCKYGGKMQYEGKLHYVGKLQYEGKLQCVDKVQYMGKQHYEGNSKFGALEFADFKLFIRTWRVLGFSKTAEVIKVTFLILSGQTKKTPHLESYRLLAMHMLLRR